MRQQNPEFSNPTDPLPPPPSHTLLTQASLPSAPGLDPSTNASEQPTMRRSMLLTGISMLLLTWSTGAATASPASRNLVTREVTSYLPRSARSCEWAATTQNTRKHCKKCNTNAKVGAAEKVTVQVGGCGEGAGNLTTVADFTAAAVNVYVPLVVNGNLIVTGTSTHEGLETFNGDIATNVIYSTDPDAVSVQIPGSGADSTQIGPGGKEMCVPMRWGVGVMMIGVALPCPMCLNGSDGGGERLSRHLRHLCKVTIPPHFTLFFTYSRGVRRDLPHRNRPERKRDSCAHGGHWVRW